MTQNQENGTAQSPQEVLLGLYQQESHLRKKQSEISSHIHIIERQKAEIYAMLNAPTKSDDELRGDLQESLDNLAALAGIREEG